MLLIADWTKQTRKNSCEEKNAFLPLPRATACLPCERSKVNLSNTSRCMSQSLLEASPLLPTISQTLTHLIQNPGNPCRSRQAHIARLSSSILPQHLTPSSISSLRNNWLPQSHNECSHAAPVSCKSRPATTDVPRRHDLHPSTPAFSASTRIHGKPNPGL